MKRFVCVMLSGPIARIVTAERRTGDAGMAMAEYIFWGSLGLAAYGCIVYPLLLCLLRRIRRASSAGSNLLTAEDPQEWPSVSVVLYAERAREVIVGRIEDLLASGYPTDRLEIIVCCGIDEEFTGDLVRTFDESVVRLIQLRINVSRTVAINAAVANANGEIVVLTDSDTSLAAEGLCAIVRHFQDPWVGGVCGNNVVVSSATQEGGRGIPLATHYENFIGVREAELGMLFELNGSLCALRRELYQPIPTETSIGNLLLGTAVHRRGYRLVFEPEAIAYRNPPQSTAGELPGHRPIHIENQHGLNWPLSLLNPFKMPLAFACWFHRLLRRACPLLLIAAIIGNASLAGEPFYLRLLLLEEFALLLAIIGFWLLEDDSLMRSFGMSEYAAACRRQIYILKNSCQRSR